MNIKEMDQMLTAIFGDINNLPHTDLWGNPNVHPLALAQQHVNLAVLALRRYAEAVEKDSRVFVVEDDEGAVPTSPEEEDLIIAHNSRDKWVVGQYGGRIVTSGLPNQEAAEGFVVMWMARENFYPTVWIEDDHGGHTQADLSDAIRATD